MYKKAREFTSRLPGKIKVGAAGIIISLLSIFIVDSSVEVFSVFYLLGAFLIFISAVMGIRKFNMKSVGEVISGIAVLMLMFGVFAVLGFSRNFYYVQLAGIFLLLIESFLRSIEKKKSSKDETDWNAGNNEQ